MIQVQDLVAVVSKDILNLVYLSKYFGLPEVANFWESVVTLNNWHQNRISKLILKKLFGTISGKKICILGFAFKANTNDTRESAAINICYDLLEEGAILSINDPKVTASQIELDLGITESKINPDLHEGDLDTVENQWEFHNNIELAAEGADAIVILTAWDEYSEIDWNKISQKMRKPSWVFDARSIVNPNDVIKSGLNFWRVGDGNENFNKN